MTTGVILDSLLLTVGGGGARYRCVAMSGSLAVISATIRS